MKQIRDALYGYVRISDLEKAFLQQPELLRLHRILQNSSAYHTYPNNRGTRFSHSIGTMHVAGLLYRSLVHNSRDLAPVLTGAVRQYLEQTVRYEEAIAYLKTDTDPFYGAEGWRTPRNAFDDPKDIERRGFIEDGEHIILFQA